MRYLASGNLRKIRAPRCLPRDRAGETSEARVPQHASQHLLDTRSPVFPPSYPACLPSAVVPRTPPVWLTRQSAIGSLLVPHNRVEEARAGNLQQLASAKGANARLAFAQAARQNSEAFREAEEAVSQCPRVREEGRRCIAAIAPQAPQAPQAVVCSPAAARRENGVFGECKRCPVREGRDPQRVDGVAAQREVGE